MRKWMDWWKKEAGGSAEKRYITLVKSTLLAALPLVCCLVYCAARGHRLGEVYLPSSEWNDELFYYKQVGGIVKYGYPLGYFGFNESHALKLSFAAWSPVLVLPWVFWGVLFGWNLMSPIYCNIFLMCFCCFCFVWLVRPAWKQLGILTVLFCLYTPFVRYMLSGMPEVICFSVLILFYSLAINYLRAESMCKLVLLFLISVFMTLMRPYLVLFLLLPAYFWIRRESARSRRWLGLAGSAAVMAAALGMYACIGHFFSAEYFEPLFSTEWIRAFFERGLFGGIGFTVRKLYSMGREFLEHTKLGIRQGLASGAIFAGFLVCTVVLTGQSLRDWRLFRRLRTDARAAAGVEEKEITETKRTGIRARLVIEAHLAFSCIAMLFALLLMYRLTEGSKHLLTFMSVSVFVISLMETGFFKKAALVGISFAWLYSYMAVDPYDYQVPFLQEERKASLDIWQGVLDGELVPDRSAAPGYENVVIWVYNDTMDGEMIKTKWQLLYALPDGYGINCCVKDYVMNHFSALKSRYLAVPTGGEIDGLCRTQGYRRLYGDEDMVLYEREP